MRSTSPAQTKGAPAAPEDARHREDVGWVRQVRAGDNEAFARLVRRHGPELHRVLMRFLKNDEDVGDLLQEVFVKAYGALDRYDPTLPFFPWIRKIAVNSALNELDKRKRRGEALDPELALQAMPAAERSDAAVRERELVEAVEQGLDELPPEWAAVFRLRAQEGLSYAEIADALDMPLGSVMSRLARARARLAEQLRDRYGPHGELAHE